MEENKIKIKTEQALRVHTWLSTAVFFWPRRGEEADREWRREDSVGCRASTHTICSSSHPTTWAGQRLKKFHTVFIYKPQLRWNKQQHLFIPETCSYTRCWIFQVRLEMKLDRGRLKTFKSCCWRREKERPSEYLW